MKNSVAILLLLLLAACSNQKKNNLIEQGIKQDTIAQREEYISADNENYYPDSVLIRYMEDNYGAVVETKTYSDTMKSDYDTVIFKDCGTKYFFANGNYYDWNECAEMAGVDLRIYIQGATKEDLKNLIDRLCKKERYDWYENNTEYRPEMYYEELWTFQIVTENGKNIISLGFSTT